MNATLFIIGQAIVIVIGLIGIYVKISLKLKELEIRVSMVEKQDDQIYKKLDHIFLLVGVCRNNRLSSNIVSK